MAIRYSGDVEVRMLHQKHSPFFRVTVRLPRDRWSENVNSKRTLASASPEDYDRVALIILTALDRKNPGTLPCERDPGGKITFRRIFQAPCPIR